MTARMGKAVGGTAERRWCGGWREKAARLTVRLVTEETCFIDELLLLLSTGKSSFNTKSPPVSAFASYGLDLASSSDIGVPS
jgi:hypothetical protein